MTIEHTYGRKLEHYIRDFMSKKATVAAVSNERILLAFQESLGEDFNKLDRRNLQRRIRRTLKFYEIIGRVRSTIQVHPIRKTAYYTYLWI